MKEKLVVVALVNANKGSEDLLRQGLMTLVEAAPEGARLRSVRPA
ncbi:hypothetical protein ACHMW9_01645 (plasmid) [Mesorhizobium terrae]